MSKLFGRNIEKNGRILRAVIAGVLFLGGLYALTQILWLSAILLVSSAFVLFEALKGWCLMRACGIKTRL